MKVIPFIEKHFAIRQTAGHLLSVVTGNVYLNTGIVGVLNTVVFTTASRTAQGPTQPPIQLVPGALSLGIKRPGREAYHSFLSSAVVKE
jgi:hypothetical protein